MPRATEAAQEARRVCPHHQEAAFELMLNGIRRTEPCPKCGEIPEFGNMWMTPDLHPDGPDTNNLVPEEFLGEQRCRMGLEIVRKVVGPDLMEVKTKVEAIASWEVPGEEDHGAHRSRLDVWTKSCRVHRT